MKKYRRSGPLMVLLFLSLFFTQSVIPVHAGPLNSFANSPIPYWNDSSDNIDLTWSSTEQTVTVNDTGLDSWLSNSWNKRKEVNITGSVGAGTSYQVNITVTYDSDMQADFDDLRFTASDGVTEWDYWIEHYTASTSAVVWVEVRSSLESSVVFYMYYGNAGCSTTSNGDDTFLMFENWSTESVRAAIWDITDANGAVTYSAVDANHGKVAKVDANAAATYKITSDYDTASPVALMFRAYIEEAGAGNTGRIGSGHDGAFAFNLIDTTATGEQFYVYDDDGNQDSQAMAAGYVDAWVTFQITRDGTNSKLIADTLLIETASCQPDIVTTNPVASLRVTDSEDDIYSDWFAARKFITTEPAFSSYGSEEEKVSDLDLDIPIDRQERQTIQFLINSTDLDSEVRFELYNGATASGTYCTLNNTYVNFASTSMLDNTEVQTSGLTVIQFTVDSEQATTAISIADEDLYMLDSWSLTQTVTGFNWLKMSDSSFNGSFTLYYLNGDTNYTVTRNTPEWTKTGSSDTAIEQHIFGLFSIYENDDLSHDVSYFTDMPFINYLRTEFFMGWEDIDNDCSQEYNITFMVDQYTVKFNVHLLVSAAGSTLNTTVIISNSTNTLFDRESTHIATASDTTQAKIMIWRTQENQLAIMMWGDFDGNSLWTGGWDYDAGENTEGFNETLWITDPSVSDWSETNITLDYYVDGNAATDDGIIEFIYPYFEYEYWRDEGVVQPHFSSVYWGGRGYVRDANGEIVDHDDWDGYHEPRNETKPLEWWEVLGQMFQTGMDDFGHYAEEWSQWMDPIFDPMRGGINWLVDGVENLFNTVGASDPIDFDFFDVIITSLGGLFVIISWVFSSVGFIITAVTAGMTWATTYIFVPQTMLLIGLSLIAIPLLAFSGMDFMGKGTGFSGATAWLVTYFLILVMLLSFMYRIVTGALMLIGNYLPFT